MHYVHHTMVFWQAFLVHMLCRRILDLASYRPFLPAPRIPAGVAAAFVTATERSQQSGRARRPGVKLPWVSQMWPQFCTNGVALGTATCLLYASFFFLMGKMEMMVVPHDITGRHKKCYSSKDSVTDASQHQYGHW